MHGGCVLFSYLDANFIKYYVKPDAFMKGCNNSKIIKKSRSRFCAIEKNNGLCNFMRKFSKLLTKPQWKIDFLPIFYTSSQDPCHVQQLWKLTPFFYDNFSVSWERSFPFPTGPMCLLDYMHS